MLFAAVLFGGLPLLGSCSDPVHEAEVDALGPERRGVRPGASHRPGQNCRVCHGGEGPGEPEFVIAGTVYTARNVLEPLRGTEIVVQDATGETHTAVSNEVGNFYISTTSWTPVFPLSVSLVDARADEAGTKKMVTTIGRNGACALCHYGNDDEPTHEPPVYLRAKAL